MLNNKILRSDKGFTLVEMLVILMIIGVVVAILVGVMGNPVTKATRDGAVAKISDDMRTLKDACDLNSIDQTGTMTDLYFTTTLGSLVSDGLITQVPLPPNSAGSGTAYDLNDTEVSPGQIWLNAGAGNEDLTIFLTGVKDEICKAFNQKHVDPASVGEVAFSKSVGPQCLAGAGQDLRLIVWPGRVK